MKINELRIGNIINDTSGYDLSITNIKLKKDSGYIKVEEYTGFVDVDDCCGVDITDDLLILFGFTKEYPFYSKGIFRYNLFNAQCYVNGQQITGKDIFYLHELQNLYFALTGEELTTTSTTNNSTTNFN